MAVDKIEKILTLGYVFIMLLIMFYMKEIMTLIKPVAKECFFLMVGTILIAFVVFVLRNED